jgi:hypothetical protein
MRQGLLWKERFFAEAQKDTFCEDAQSAERNIREWRIFFFFSLCAICTFAVRLIFAQ